MRKIIPFLAVLLSLPAFAQDDGKKIYISADLEGVVGVVTDQQLGPDGFEYQRFREFMTAEMEAWFATLAELPGWGLDALVGEDGHVTAAGFGYQDSDGYYLYNSSYNPQFSDSSPGVVLLGRLIELTIERGKPVFDFLKGDEHYKYRLGAQPRPLFQVVGSA